MLRHIFTANNIYNLDGIGNSIVRVSPKIICAKGIKQVDSVASGERGINVTMIVAVNAFGNHQAKVLTGGGDLREAQVDVPLC